MNEKMGSLLAAGVYNTNIPAGGEVELFSAARQGFSGINVLARSSHDVILSVECGVVFNGMNEWISARDFLVPAGAADGGGLNLPIDFSSDFVRVKARNANSVATTQFHAAGYLVHMVGFVPGFQKPVLRLWNSHVLTVGSGNHYSPTADLSNAMGARLVVRFTNGATGPSSYISASSEISVDGVNWVRYKTIGTNSVIGNVVTSLTDGFDNTLKYLRVYVPAPTGQPVTIDAWATRCHF